jgi:hypothetical protein
MEPFMQKLHEMGGNFMCSFVEFHAKRSEENEKKISSISRESGLIAQKLFATYITKLYTT